MRLIRCPVRDLAVGLALLGHLALLAGASAQAVADDPHVATRVDRLERGLGSAGTGLHEHPRATRHDLERARAELRSLQIAPSARTTAVERLERELHDLERDADRVARRHGLDRSLAAIQMNRARLALPDYLRLPSDTDIRGSLLPIGAGKQVVLVQRSLRSAAQELAQARHAAAGRYLARAEGALRSLGDAHAGDPMLDALEGEAAGLRARLQD
jgi:chromosomal replication initiation ATPase DnaA